MKRSPIASTVLPLLLLAGVSALSACESSAKPTASANTSTTSASQENRRAEIGDEFTATAQVIGVDASNRIVTLRREDGVQFDVKCGEAVRNFDQIGVGDELRVRYKSTLAAERMDAGTAAQPAVATLAAARAKKGARPGAGVGMGVTVRVKIESIDREHDIVVFSLAGGELIAHRIRTSQGKDFVAGLKVGDVVQLDYSEAMAMTVEKI